MKYSEAIENIARSILVNFDSVYHSAEIVQAEKEKYPAISVDDEWIYLGPTDQKETIYIRRNGDDEVIGELPLGSCSVSYKMRSPLRIVYFKDHAKTQNKIVSKLMQSVLIKGTFLNKVIRDKWKLKKDESSADYKLGATTAYFAIDIYALWNLIPDECNEDFCVDLENPLKKESCSVVV